MLFLILDIFLFISFLLRKFLAKGHHDSTSGAGVVSDRVENRSYLCIGGLNRGRGLTGGSLVVAFERSGRRVCWTHRTAQPARLG